jgi:hypothetical protein
LLGFASLTPNLCADVKAIAEAGGDPTKYDKRIKEMLKYFDA